MNRLFFIAVLFLTHQISNAQTTSFFLVNLAIEHTSLLNQAPNSNIKDLLFKKLTSLCNNVDGVIIDELSDYYLVSDIYSTELKRTNAGFLPVGIYKMNFKLKMIYKLGGKSFKELNFSKEYVVNTEAEAAGILINDLSFSDTDLNEFFNDGRKNMKRLYSENCNILIESAKKYQSIGQSEKALAICLTIPSDVACFNSISSLINELYTSLSYKSDYNKLLQAQDCVSKGNYESAFATLKEISLYSQFYSQAQSLAKQINEFIFNQKELDKMKDLIDSEKKLKELEIDLQQKRNELQQSINKTNIDIANQKNESDRQISQHQEENKKQIRSMELQSQERKEMIKSAGNLLNSFINRPQPPKNTNFYIIK